MSNDVICPKHIIAKYVADALAEDLLVFPDYTAELILNSSMVNASIKTNQDMVVCGIDFVNQAFLSCDSSTKIFWQVKEGNLVKAGTILCNIMGNARGLLTAERTALNFLQTLSATATTVYSYVQLVKDTGVKVMDTRKTIPGLRLAQKYAVTVGGGYNQRFGLYDGVLIKENHIEALGGVDKALARAFSMTPNHIPIQIEIESVSQFKQALKCGARFILLDNMPLDKIVMCVNHNTTSAELEVSGNISLENIHQYANTGVNRISIGALTKNIQAIDLSMRIN